MKSRKAGWFPPHRLAFCISAPPVRTFYGRGHMIQLTRPVVAGLALIAALGACKKDNGAAVDTTAATTARVDTSAAATTTAPADNKWSTASVAGFTWAANEGEYQLGQLGEKKATNASVKAFAKEMVT